MSHAPVTVEEASGAILDPIAVCEDLLTFEAHDLGRPFLPSGFEGAPRTFRLGAAGGGEHEHQRKSQAPENR